MIQRILFLADRMHTDQFIAQDRGCEPLAMFWFNPADSRQVIGIGTGFEIISCKFRRNRSRKFRENSRDA